MHQALFRCDQGGLMWRRYKKWGGCAGCRPACAVRPLALNDTPESETPATRVAKPSVPNSATMPLPQRNMPTVLDSRDPRHDPPTDLDQDFPLERLRRGAGPGNAPPAERAPEYASASRAPAHKVNVELSRSGVVLLPSRTQVMPRGSNQQLPVK